MIAFGPPPGAAAWSARALARASEEDENPVQEEPANGAARPPGEAGAPAAAGPAEVTEASAVTDLSAMLVTLRRRGRDRT
ncbi:MAG: hypothetical protein M3Y33_21945 [Actinomycetota bacterium]|nr:hypothetical protein [Actinomycetota bacterium]